MDVDEPTHRVVRALMLSEDDAFPNNPALPLLFYPGAFSDDGGDLASEIEARFAANGWPPAWRYGVYPFQHYHAEAHEVLGVFRGSAEIQFGGPAGQVVSVSAGDAVLLPAGAAHKSISSSGDFGVVGAYPPGQSPDMCYGKEGERPRADEKIRAVPIPTADPVLGPAGGVVELWR